MKFFHGRNSFANLCSHPAKISRNPSSKYQSRKKSLNENADLQKSSLIADLIFWAPMLKLTKLPRGGLDPSVQP